MRVSVSEARRRVPSLLKRVTQDPTLRIAITVPHEPVAALRAGAPRGPGGRAWPRPGPPAPWAAVRRVAGAPEQPVDKVLFAVDPALPVAQAANLARALTSCQEAGLFVVGLDITPGVYRTAGPASGSNGYIALLRSTRTSDIMDNLIVKGPATITVGPGVKAVHVRGCQPWSRLGDNLDAVIAAASELRKTENHD